MDVGCGQGVLLRRLPSCAYSKYMGIDVSRSAIAAASKLQIECSAFLVTDCESYTPTEGFDVIVFNEVLYCLCDPLGIVGRYSRSLHEGGVLLVSVCTAARGADAILKRLGAEFQLLDATRIIHGETRLSWDLAALSPKRAVGKH